MTATRIVPPCLAPVLSAEEHLALLADVGPFNRLVRKDDLLDDGVAAIFGLMDSTVVLLALCFHCRKFTLPETTIWLAERGFRPSATLVRCAGCDAPLSADEAHGDRPSKI